MEIIEYYNSKLKYIFLLVLSLIFVAIGVYAIFDTAELWGGIITAGFFGIGITFCLKEILDNRPRIIMDEDGITDRSIGVGKILWSDINKAEIMQIRQNPFISLYVEETAAPKYLKNLSLLKRFLVKTNKTFGFAQFNINLIGIDGDFNEILDIINTRSKKADA